MAPVGKQGAGLCPIPGRGHHVLTPIAAGQQNPLGYLVADRDRQPTYQTGQAGELGVEQTGTGLVGGDGGDRTILLKGHGGGGVMPGRGGR